MASGDSSAAASCWPLGRAYLRVILHCGISRETGGATASTRGAGKETASAATKATGTAEQESPAEQHDDDDGGEYESGDDDDSDSSGDGMDNVRCRGIALLPGGRFKFLQTYCCPRYLVELLAVRPRFHFVGKFFAYDSNRLSEYYCPCERGEPYRSFDSQGNLILETVGQALQDDFNIVIKIPTDDDSGTEHDSGSFYFTVDPHACNRVMTRTISTASGRQMDLTFIPMHTAIQVNVKVTLDLISASATGTGGTIYYVYGEISAHHQFYDEERVTLFSRRQDDKAEAINGELPLSQTWAAVPIYVQPLLIIKLKLSVQTNHDHDGEGNTISFRADVTFRRNQFEKIICCGDHGEVKIELSYW